jgi:uncharacterized protein involved in type VI secretion and phage assembly
MTPFNLHRERASGNSGHPGSNESELSFARASARDQGSIALDLVYQAAEVFRGMEDRARETEARAQSMFKSAAEGLKFAEQRAEAAERDRRETIDEADRRLQDASRALKQAESRITVAEDHAAAAEFRAQAAEVQAQKLLQELALVEDAIRRRLLVMGSENVA